MRLSQWHQECWIRQRRQGRKRGGQGGSGGAAGAQTNQVSGFLGSLGSTVPLSGIRKAIADLFPPLIIKYWIFLSNQTRICVIFDIQYVIFDIQYLIFDEYNIGLRIVVDTSRQL